jgi:aryl-alcohol dehydrogenase-like predicted oxidoreductase
VSKRYLLQIEANTQIANIYSNGVSEEIIGRALKKYNIPRHKVVILSKCFAYIGEEPWMQNAPEVRCPGQIQKRPKLPCG